MRRTLPELRSTWTAEWDKSNSLATFTGYKGWPGGRLFFCYRELPSSMRRIRRIGGINVEKPGVRVVAGRIAITVGEIGGGTTSCIACDVATAQIARPWHKELRWQM